MQQEGNSPMITVFPMVWSHEIYIEEVIVWRNNPLPLIMEWQGLSEQRRKDGVKVSVSEQSARQVVDIVKNGHVAKKEILKFEIVKTEKQINDKPKQ